MGGWCGEAERQGEMTMHHWQRLIVWITAVGNWLWCGERKIIDTANWEPDGDWGAWRDEGGEG